MMVKTSNNCSKRRFSTSWIIPWSIFEEYNFPTLFYGNLRPSFTCSYQKIIQVELTNVTRKLAYHIMNIYFKTIKLLIHFISSSIWIHIRKTKLSSWILTTNNVSNNVNLDKLLKANLGYKKLGRIRTSLDYLNSFWKDVFIMIKQLGPPSFL